MRRLALVFVLVSVCEAADYLIIERADGELSVTELAPGQDENEELAKWERSARDSWLPVQRSARGKDLVLPDRYWRRAWKWSGSAVTVDRAEAQEIQRANLLHRADLRRGGVIREWMEATAAGESAKAAEAAAKVTAITTTAIEAYDLGTGAAPTLDNLKRRIPDVLK